MPLRQPTNPNVFLIALVASLSGFNGTAVAIHGRTGNMKRPKFDSGSILRGLLDVVDDKHVNLPP